MTSLGRDEAVVHTDAQKIAAELLKEKLQEARSQILHYEKTGIVYLAITASMAKVALDGSAHSYHLFEFVGIATTLFFIVLCACEPISRKPLEEDIANLNLSLESPLKHTQLTHQRLLVRFSLTFAIIVLLGWIALILIAPKAP